MDVGVNSSSDKHTGNATVILDRTTRINHQSLQNFYYTTLYNTRLHYTIHFISIKPPIYTNYQKYMTNNHIIEILNYMRVDPKCCFIGFYVESLFTKMLTQEEEKEVNGRWAFTREVN